MDTWAAREGLPSPLGVTWIPDEQAYNFALFSRHATGVTLLLYSDQDVVNPVAQLPMDYLKNKTGRVWHCRVHAAEMKNAKYYAYRVEGSDDPPSGGRFDPQKILLDPYARVVFFPPAFSRDAATQPGPNDGQAPLGVIDPKDGPVHWGQDRRPQHTSDLIIYEMHVKGFTRRDNSSVHPSKRGTFAGVIEKIPYLQELGVTAVELLPVCQYDPQEGNYWGYMTLNFFSPHRPYSSDPRLAGPLNEFREMVKALHAAGIEVILDMVYGHTVEGDQRGPTYSYRGIDNGSYYLLEPDLQTYRNDSGCGNVLRAGYPAVRNMILDSMRFWVKEMHVDGFRFDQASIFSRNSDGSLNTQDAPVISEISSNPDFANIRLIAEVWDVGAYELGKSFPGITWRQWNGRFRDTVRSFVKGDSGIVTDLITRIYGSDDLFPDDEQDAYHPYQSLNFITAHDGFCLYDLVAYNHKQNEANGLHNTDGADNNLSWNCGWEGDDGAPQAVLDLRNRQIKNFCCLLLLSNGTPMFCAGDEFMNTQHGNNNPYNQDNQTTWLNWDLLQKNQDIFRFFKDMIAFRKAHPSLGRSRFWREDVNWYGVGPQPDTGYESHSLAFCLHGASEDDQDLYAMINAYWEDLPFVIQEGQASDWVRVVDTSLPGPQDIAEPGQEEGLQSLAYMVKARSVVLLRRK